MGFISVGTHVVQETGCRDHSLPLERMMLVECEDGGRRGGTEGIYT